MPQRPSSKFPVKSKPAVHHHGGEIFSRRVLLIIGIFATVFLLILTRLVSVQIIKGSTYRAQAERMYNGTVNSASSSERGDIVMVNRDGTRFTLAGQLLTYYVSVNPPSVTDPSEAYAYVHSILPDVNWNEFNYIMKKNRRYRFNTPTTQAAIFAATSVTQLDTTPVDGITISPDKVRHYPGGQLAAHVLGFVGYVDDTLTGRYGLEKQYDAQLRIIDQKLYANFFVELFSTLRSLSAEDPQQLVGQATLVTTLDPEIQARAENLLQDIHDKWTPEETGIVVMDPKTGAIIAMALNPTFDVNRFREADSNSIFTNSLIQKVYEVGSIMKPLIMAFAIEEGVVTPETKYTDMGRVTVDDRTIYNFDKRARGRVNMEQVLIQSLNTGMVFIMDKLPRKAVRTYLESLGLRDKTGIDLPYEARGLTKNLDTLRRVEYANISFGQGIAVTPMAMMRALSVLANHGTLVQPYVVEQLEYPYGATRDLAAVAQTQRRSVLSPETSDTIARIMTELVDTNFKNDPNYLEHYSVAAKTGTAQIANTTGGYYSDRRLHTFFGFFPAYDPKFSIFLYASQPQGVKYSAQTLSGPFLQMVQLLVNYYNIPPDRGLLQ